MRPRTSSTLAVFGAVCAGLTLLAADAPQTSPVTRVPAAAAAQATAPARPAGEPVMAAAHAPTPAGLPVAEQNAVMKQYCVTCHNDRAKAGGLTLASFDAGAATEHADVSEKIIRKLR